MGTLIFVAHSGANPNGAALGTLTKAQNKKISLSAKGTGEGSFTINRNDAEAAWCAPGNYVRVYLDNTAGSPVFAFWLAVGGDSLLDGQAEEGGEVLSRAGAGALAYLAEATIWHTAISGGSAVVGTDGYWHWPSRHPAAIMVRLLEEAQARGALPGLTWTFTRTLDSNGNAWSQTAADEFKLPIGQDLLSALNHLMLADFYVRMDPNLTLHAWEQIGVDRIGTIEFAEGVNIRDSADRRIQDNPLRSVALIQAARKDGSLRFREVTDATIQALIGRRREGFLRYEGTRTNAVLDRVGLRWLRSLREQFEGPTSLGVVERVNERALINYNVGDLVSVHIPGVFDHKAVTISSLALVETDAGEYDPIVNFNDEQAIAGAGGGAGGGHGAVGANTASVDYLADLSSAGANMVRNSNFEGTGDWVTGSLWSMPFASANAYAGSRTARTSPAGATTGELVSDEFITVDRTKDWWFSFWSRLSARTAGMARCRVREYSSTNTLLQSTDIDLLTVETAWTRHSLHFGPNTVGGRIAFHASTVKVKIVFWVLNTPTLTWEVDAVQLEQSTILTSYAPAPYELLNGSVTSEKMADLAVTLAKLASEAVDITKFASGIRPPRVVAALPAHPYTSYLQDDMVVLTTDHKLYRLTDATASGTSGWSRAVDGADIIANSIIAAAIAAGAIGTRELAADAVTAGKLYVGNFHNLAEDPGFERAGDAATTWVKEAGWSVGVSGPRSGIRNAAFNGSSGAIRNALFVDCVPGDKFYISGWLTGVSGADGTAQTRISWWDGSKTFISASSSGAVVSDATYRQSAAVHTAPAGAAFARAEFVVLGRTVGTWRADDIFMGKAIAGTLIEDGTITTIHLAALSITAALLAAGSVTTDKIAALAVVAGKIAAATITADKIAASQIHLGLMADDARNMCPNPNFENMGGAAVNTDGVTIPGWSPLGATTRITDGTFRAGSKSLRITNPGGVITSLGSVSSPSRGGARVRARCWVRGWSTNSATATAALAIDFLSVTGGFLGNAQSNLTVGTNAAWQELVVNGVLPTDAVSVRVRCLNTAASAAGDITYHDDIRFIFTDEDIDHAGGSVSITAAGMSITNGKLSVTNPSGTVLIDGSSRMYRIVATGTLQVTVAAATLSGTDTDTLTGLGSMSTPKSWIAHAANDAAATGGVKVGSSWPSYRVRGRAATLQASGNPHDIPFVTFRNYQEIATYLTATPGNLVVELDVHNDGDSSETFYANYQILSEAAI